MSTFILVVSVIVALLPVADWTASYILHRAARLASHDNIALRERARIAIILAIVTTTNSIFADNQLFDLGIPPEFATIALAASFILVGLPNLYWLSLYFRNKFKKT